jgi:outer membrane lipoprotein SlyB
MRRRFIVIAAAFALAAAGQAPVLAQTARADKNVAIRVAYGKVLEIEQVKLDSNVAGGAAVGGMIGLATGSGRGGKSRRKRTAIGAAAGAAMTKAAEGSSKANGYTVEMMSGSRVKVVTEQGGIRVGDCVAVEQGATTNVRLVSPTLCEPETEALLKSDPEIIEEQQEEAAECAAAKDELLNAETDEQLDRAIRKMKILCDR